MNKLENMKIYENFTDNKILNNSYFAIRVDGRSFHTEVKKMQLRRPFDKYLRDIMIKAIKEVMKDFKAVFAYTESDECTFLFPKVYDNFDRRQEKIVSLVASKMSVEFNRSIEMLGIISRPIFDARILTLPSKSEVIKCFQWRQMDSHRNAISTDCFWSLVKGGKSERSAQRIMDGMKDSDKNELLFKEFNINYNDTPDWERKGTMVYWEEFEKEGFNPIKKTKEMALRKRLISEDVKIHFKTDNLEEWINKGIKII